MKTNFHLFCTLLGKLCVHYANGFGNVDSVYFFYSNPVLTNFNVSISFKSYLFQDEAINHVPGAEEHRPRQGEDETDIQK
jgi:hypothetical protein